MISTKVLHDLCVLARDRHWIMSVDRVCLEVIGQCSEEEFVEDTSLIDGKIVLDFRIAPVRELLGVIVNRVVSVTSDEGHGIRQHCRISLANTLESFCGT